MSARRVLLRGRRSRAISAAAALTLIALVGIGVPVALADPASPISNSGDGASDLIQEEVGPEAVEVTWDEQPLDATGTQPLDTDQQSSPGALADVGVTPFVIIPPTSTTAVIRVKVGGDRLPNGSVAPLEGVKLSLYAAGSGSSGVSTPVQGVPGAILNQTWTWARCTSDAQGDCNFVIPIRAGATSATGVATGTRFWVQASPATPANPNVPAGWYENPVYRLGGPGATPEYSWRYRFRTPAIVADRIYTSDDALGPPASNDWTESNEPDRGFMRNRPDSNLEGGMGSNLGRTTGVWSASRSNNTFPQQCGLDIALVVDTSASLGPVGMTAMKGVMSDFVDAFAGTPTSMSLFSFSNVSPGAGASNHPNLLPVTTSAQATTFRNQYSGWGSGGGTSWDRGLAEVTASGVPFDLVVMLTDGNPTVYGVPPVTTPPTVALGDSAFNSYQDVDSGIFSANQLKATGARVIALGIGPAVTAASELNLRAITGVTKGEDYFRLADFAEASEQLAALANATCQGSLEVQKMIVPPNGTIADATPAPAGWEFAASTSATGVSIAAPASASTAADSNGVVAFGLGFTSAVTSGAVQVLETQQAGYELLPVGTGAAARNATCVNTETGTTLPVTNAGTAATPGFSVIGSRDVLVRCQIFNRVLPPASLSTVKTATTIDGAPVAPGATVSAGQTIGYTITTTNAGGLSGTTTLTETVPAGTTYTGSGEGWSCVTGSAAGTTCSQAITVAAGTSVTLPFTVRVIDPVAQGITSIINVATSTGGTCIDCTTTNPVPNLTVVKSSDPASGTTITPGTPADPTVVTYTLTFSNTGGAAAPVARIDDLSDVLDDSSWGADPASPNPVVSSASVTATFNPLNKELVLGGSVPAGATITVTYWVKVTPFVDGEPAGNGRLFNVVFRPGETPPTECVPSTQLCTEHPLASYRVVKSADPVSGTQVAPGDSITYTVTATSDRGSIAGVVLTDDLSDVLDDATFVTGSAQLIVAGGSPMAVADPISSGAGTWKPVSPAFTLPEGQVATLTYRVRVNDDAWNATLHNVVTGNGEIPPVTCPTPSTGGEECETTHTVGAILAVAKVGSDGAAGVIPMPGSQFALFLDNAGAPGAELTSPALEPVVGQTGLFEVRGILPGTYWLVETVAPEGFSLLAEPVQIVIAADGAVTAPGSDAGGPITVVGYTVTVHDVPVFDLPQAGGNGDAAHTQFGLGLVAIAGLLLVLRRRARGQALLVRGGTA